MNRAKEIIEKIKTDYLRRLKEKSKPPKPVYDKLYFKALDYLNEQDLSGEVSGVIFLKTEKRD